MRKAQSAQAKGSKPSKGNLSHSERMKKAWETRRRNLAAQAGAGSTSSSRVSPQVKLDINGGNALIQRYLNYVDAAKNLGDFSILNSENFIRLDQAIRAKFR